MIFKFKLTLMTTINRKDMNWSTLDIALSKGARESDHTIWIFMLDGFTLRVVQKVDTTKSKPLFLN